MHYHKVIKILSKTELGNNYLLDSRQTAQTIHLHIFTHFANLYEVWHHAKNQAFPTLLRFKPIAVKPCAE